MTSDVATRDGQAGHVVQGFGFTAGFLTLAGIAVCALAFFAALMPETGEDEA